MPALRDSEAENVVSKSQFKPRALEFFRRVEQTGREVIITDHGRPVLKIVPFSATTDEVLNSLRHTVLRYDDPTEPVDPESWEVLQ